MTEQTQTITLHDHETFTKKPYGDTLFVLTTNREDTHLANRLFVNPFPNSNPMLATALLDKVINVMEVKRTPQLAKSVYTLLTENHPRGHDMVRAMIEDKLVDTHNHPSNSASKRPFNVVMIDCSTIPASVVDSLKGYKLALLPASNSETEKYAFDFPDFKQSIIHYGASPELFQTARTYLQSIGFEV